MEKAKVERNRGALIVCLVPARTDTQWWQRHVAPRGEVTFIEGRLRLGNGEGSATFRSAVVVLRPSWYLDYEQTRAAHIQSDRARREPDWGSVEELWWFLSAFHTDDQLARMSSDDLEWLTDLLHQVIKQ